MACSSSWSNRPASTEEPPGSFPRGPGACFTTSGSEASLTPCRYATGPRPWLARPATPCRPGCRSSRPVVDSVARRFGMASRASQYRYWQQPRPDGHPIVPRHDSTGSARAIVKRLTWEVQKTDLIIELGSGDGRLLAALVEAGFTNVMGVEINPHAVAVMRQNHPELEQVQVLVGPAEQVLKGFGDDSVRCVIAAATLGHIHPDSADLFDTITRITSMVIAVDGPPKQLRRQYPWDIEKEFTSRGMILRKLRRAGQAGPPEGRTGGKHRACLPADGEAGHAARVLAAAHPARQRLRRLQQDDLAQPGAAQAHRRPSARRADPRGRLQRGPQPGVPARERLPPRGGHRDQPPRGRAAARDLPGGSPTSRSTSALRATCCRSSPTTASTWSSPWP